MPLFKDYKVPKLRKDIADIKIDGDANPLSGIPGVSKFVLRLSSFMNIRGDGVYRFYVLVGRGDMAMVKIDGSYMAMVECSEEPTPTTFDALMSMGDHELVIEFANAGFENKLRIAYQGPDTMNKPRPIKPLDRTELTEMAIPAEIAKPAKVLTRPPPTAPAIPVTAVGVTRGAARPGLPPTRMMPARTTPAGLFTKSTARPSDVRVRSPIPRAPWANPAATLRPQATTKATSVVTRGFMAKTALVTEPIKGKKISNKVVIGTVFGVMAGVIAAGIIFKFF